MIGAALLSAQCNTVEPVYYGHLGTNQRCPDYQGLLIFQVSLYDIKHHLSFVCGF